MASLRWLTRAWISPNCLSWKKWRRYEQELSYKRNSKWFWGNWLHSDGLGSNSGPANGLWEGASTNFTTVVHRGCNRTSVMTLNTHSPELAHKKLMSVNRTLLKSWQPPSTLPPTTSLLLNTTPHQQATKSTFCCFLKWNFRARIEEKNL